MCTLLRACQALFGQKVQGRSRTSARLAEQKCKGVPRFHRGSEPIPFSLLRSTAPEEAKPTSIAPGETQSRGPPRGPETRPAGAPPKGAASAPRAAWRPSPSAGAPGPPVAVQGLRPRRPDSTPRGRGLRPCPPAFGRVPPPPFPGLEEEGGGPGCSGAWSSNDLVARRTGGGQRAHRLCRLSTALAVGRHSCPRSGRLSGSGGQLPNRLRRLSTPLRCGQGSCPRRARVRSALPRPVHCWRSQPHSVLEENHSVLSML